MWAWLLPAALTLGPAGEAQESIKLEEAIHLMETRGDYEAAVRLFQQVAASSDRGLVARALLYLGLCYEELDETEAASTYETLIRKFPDETELVDEARGRLRELAPTRAPPPAMVARRVAEHADFEAGYSAAFPDGMRFTTPDGSTGDLAVYELGTGEKHHLTHKGSWDVSQDVASHSVVSPDGNWVAYAWLDAATDRQELRVIGADGTNERVVFRDESVKGVRPDAWSPDGTHVLTLLTEVDKARHIALISVADSDASILKTFSGPGPLETTISPTGALIAYDSPEKGHVDSRDLFMLDMTSGEEIPVAPHPANDLWPVFTPDGRGILFYSNRVGVYGLWLQPVDADAPRGAPVQIRQEMGHAAPIGFTRDGSYYYARVLGSSNVYVASLDSRSGAVRETPDILDTGYTGWNLMPAWTTDGSCLAHISFQNALSVLPESERLIVSCSEGDELRRRRELSPALDFFRTPSWSPDGGSILVMGRDPAHRWGLYSIDSESGEVSALLQERGVTHPQWAPDGRSIVFKRTKPDSTSVVKRQLATNDEEVLFEVSRPNRLHGFHLSPDGGRLAFVTSEEGVFVWRLKIVSLEEGGGGVTLFEAPTEKILFRPVWSPDGASIWVSLGTHDLREPAELWRVFSSNGKAERTGVVGNGLRELAVHPDGQRLAFISGTLYWPMEIWVLQNFLPSEQALR